MSETRARAKEIEPVVDGVWRWHVDDERLGGIDGESFAVVRDGEVVLIDPHPVALTKLRALGKVAAIVLTIQSHQRSAWRYRKTFGVPVWAPRKAVGLEEKPDRFYDDGDELPGGLVAMHAPGPCDASFILVRPGERPVAFCGDVAIRAGRGDLGYPPAEYQDMPERAAASVKRLVREIDVKVACFGHGRPMVRNARAALARLAETRPG